METQIINSKKSLEEVCVKLDSKLVEVLTAKLNQQQDLPKLNDQVDHSMALKVAHEIMRIQKNISKMDEDTVGLKSLLHGIEHVREILATKGYQIFSFMNKEYDDGMDIEVVSFKISKKIPTGSRIISEVVLPQLDYNGTSIQKAQVIVSQN